MFARYAVHGMLVGLLMSQAGCPGPDPMIPQAVTCAERLGQVIDDRRLSCRQVLSEINRMQLTDPTCAQLFGDSGPFMLVCEEKDGG